MGLALSLLRYAFPRPMEQPHDEKLPYPVDPNTALANELRGQKFRVDMTNSFCGWPCGARNPYYRRLQIECDRVLEMYNPTCFPPSIRAQLTGLPSIVVFLTLRDARNSRRVTLPCSLCCGGRQPTGRTCTLPCCSQWPCLCGTTPLTPTSICWLPTLRRLRSGAPSPSPTSDTIYSCLRTRSHTVPTTSACCSRNLRGGFVKVLVTVCDHPIMVCGVAMSDHLDHQSNAAACTPRSSTSSHITGLSKLSA